MTVKSQSLGRTILAGLVLSLMSAAALTAPAWADANCGYEHTLKSQNSNTPAKLIFINKDTGINDYVTIYWLNYQGKRVLYKHLHGGASWTVNTYVTHPWVVATANWEAYMICQEIIMPVAPIRAVVVGGYPEE